jgi:hypothetical protein
MLYQARWVEIRPSTALKHDGLLSDRAGPVTARTRRIGHIPCGGVRLAAECRARKPGRGRRAAAETQTRMAACSPVSSQRHSRARADRRPAWPHARMLSSLLAEAQSRSRRPQTRMLSSAGRGHRPRTAVHAPWADRGRCGVQEAWAAGRAACSPRLLTPPTSMLRAPPRGQTDEGARSEIPMNGGDWRMKPNRVRHCAVLFPCRTDTNTAHSDVSSLVARRADI